MWARAVLVLAILSLLPAATDAQMELEVVVAPPSAADEPFPHRVFQRSFGSGHASLGLRADWQAAAGRAATDYGLGGIRQHGVFDDDMGPVATRAADGSIAYNFSSIDTLWDAMLARNIHPIVELSFMPSALANCSSDYAPDSTLPPCPNKKGQPGGWVKTGQTGGPRRWSEWYDLVFATVSHAVHRYGLQEVQGWEFEVWSASPGHVPAAVSAPVCLCVARTFVQPLAAHCACYLRTLLPPRSPPPPLPRADELWGMANCTAAGAYGNTSCYNNLDSLGNYMLLYNSSSRAVKAVHSSLRVGGPASVGLSLLPEFLAGCEEYGAPFDFCSSHSYPTDGGSEPTPSSLFPGTCPGAGSGWDPHCWTNNVAIASSKVPAGKDFYLTEYNVGCCEPYNYHDLSAAAAFVFWVMPTLGRVTKVASYWTFSDLFVEDWPDNNPIGHPEFTVSHLPAALSHLSYR